MSSVLMIATSVYANQSSVSKSPQSLLSTYDLSSEIVTLPKGTMEKVGHFALGIRDFHDGQSAHLSYQAFPWLQFTMQHDSQHEKSDTYQYNISISPNIFTNQAFSVSSGFLDVLNSANQRGGFIATTWRNQNYDVSFGLKSNKNGEQFYGGASLRIPQWKSQFALQYAQHLDDAGNTVFTDQSASSNSRTAGWQLAWEWYLHQNLMVSVTHNASQSIGLGVQWRTDLNSKKIRHYDYAAESLNIVSEPNISNGYPNIDVTVMHKLGWQLVATQFDNIDLTLYISATQSHFEREGLHKLHEYLNQILNLEFNKIHYIIVRHNIPVYKQTLAMFEEPSQSHHLHSVWQLNKIKPILRRDISYLKGSPVLSPFQLSAGLINQIWLPEPSYKKNENKIKNLSFNTSLNLSSRWQWAQLWDITASYQLNLHQNMQKASLSSQIFGEDELIPHRTALYFEWLNKTAQLEKIVLNGYFPSVKYYTNHAYLHTSKMSVGKLSPTLKGITFEHAIQPWQSGWSFGANATLGKPTSSLSQFMQRPNEPIYAFLLQTNWISHKYQLGINAKAGRFLGGDEGLRLAFNKQTNNGWNIRFWYSVSMDNGQRYVDKGLLFSFAFGQPQSRLSSMRFQSSIREVRGNSGYSLSNNTLDNPWGDLDFSVRKKH